MHQFGIAIFLAVLFVGSASAQVTVENPWVRATVANQAVSSGFMRITAAKDMRLVEVQALVADSTEIHEMKMEGHVMKMRPVLAIDLPAGKEVELKPNGFHIMLMGLKLPLKAGDSISLTLVLEGQNKRRQSVDVRALVRPMNATSSEHH